MSSESPKVISTFDYSKTCPVLSLRNDTVVAGMTEVRLNGEVLYCVQSLTLELLRDDVTRVTMVMDVRLDVELPVVVNEAP